MGQEQYKYIPEQKEVFSDSQDSSPIKPGEVFKPSSALKKIRKASIDQKQELVDEFKEKLVYQKEGFGVFELQMVALFEKFPDIELDECLIKTKAMAKQLGLDREQIKIAEYIIKTFWKRHQAVREARKEIPEDDKLFQFYFGRKPKGKVEVIVGPASFFFLCFDKDDYALIYNEASRNKEIPDAAEISRAEKTGGFFRAQNVLVLEKPELVDGTTLVGKATGGFYDRATRKHEQQHAFFELKKDGMESVKRHPKHERDLRSFRMELKLAKDEGKKRVAMIRYFREIRRSSDDRRGVAGEILAYFAGCSHRSDEIFKILTTLKEKEGLYDYFDKDYKDILIKQLIDDLGEENKSIVEECFEQVFNVEYKQVLKEAIDSLDELINSGYSLDTAVATMGFEPLSKWKKTVQRLKQAQNLLQGVA